MHKARIARQTSVCREFVDRRSVGDKLKFVAGVWKFFSPKQHLKRCTPPSGDLSIECRALDTLDRVAVTYPDQTKLVIWVSLGDRYAAQCVPNHAIYREVAATRRQHQHS